MIIVFKTNVGTAAYDSDTILNLEYTPSLGLYITYAATNNKLNCVVKTNRHYLKNDKEFDNILEQWKQSKEKK
ncbi:MAG: hypothetical protein J6T74_06680 [Clostridia bacterium]|jgi:hypothetical protein|nr:hypothetical protein [Clostridia bacterium]